VLGIVNSVNTGIRAGALSLFNLRCSESWILQGFIADRAARDGRETAFPRRLFAAPLSSGKILLPQIAPGIAVKTAFLLLYVLLWFEVVFWPASWLPTTNGKREISMAAQRECFGFHTDIGMVMAFTLTSMLPGALRLLFAMRQPPIARVQGRAGDPPHLKITLAPLCREVRASRS